MIKFDAVVLKLDHLLHASFTELRIEI